MAPVTLKQLRAIAAVVRTGTVTAAARELHVTPPAVTTQMHLLAEAYGVPLTARLGDRFVPTEAGEEVLAAAARVEAALRECDEAVAALRGLRGGRVAVGVVSTAKYFAPQALGAFARTRPQVEVSLFVGNREAVIEALRTYAIDFAIMGRPPLDIEVEQAPIGAHPHVIVASPDHGLADRRGLKPKTLSEEVFLVREQGSGTRLLMESFFSGAGVSPRLGMEIGSNETIKQAVIAGLGIAFISAHTVAAELADGRLATLDVEGLPIMRQWHVVKRADKRLLPAAAAMKDFLISLGAAMLPALPESPPPRAARPRRTVRSEAVRKSAANPPTSST